MKKLIWLIAAVLIAGSVAFAQLQPGKAAQDKPNLGTYKNNLPSFEISIPENCNEWGMRFRDSRESPVLFIKSKSNSLPFVSTYIDFYDVMPDQIKQLWQDADKALELKALSDKQFEQQALPDVEFIKGQKASFAGRPAFDRIYRSKKAGATYHSIRVFFPEGIVGFTLNSLTGSFEQDDAAFMAIINTLKS